MKRIIPVVAVALAFSGAVGAQDTKEKSKTQVKVDDGRAITLTGCLQQGPGNLFLLERSSGISSDEVKTKDRVKRDVDDNGTEVKESAKSKIDHDGDAVGTSGLTATYDLSPQAGVDLAGHVGQQVQLTAIALDPKSGDDDAKVTVKEKNSVDREDAPDAKVRSKTTADLPRGAHSRVSVISVKSTGSSCAAQ